MFKLLKVEGDSMYPLLKQGDKLLCMKPLSISEDDVVVFSHNKEGLMIKKVTRIDENGYFVKGSSPYSIDSSTFGYLRKEDILYKMVYKF